MVHKILFVLFFIFLSITIKSQVIFEENFDYEIGELYSVSNNIWVKSPTTGAAVFIVNGNLTYNEYPSSGIGKMMFLDASGTTTPKCGAVRNFDAVNSNTIYCSFLFNVISTNDMESNESSGDYFCNWGTTNKSYIVIRKGSNTSQYSIGLKKTSQGSVIWYGTELEINTTYLLVMSYTFQPGEDAIKLWINPLLNTIEPSPDITITTGADNTEISAIQFRQNTKSGDIYIDGIRVATSWSYAPLPVELISFTAQVENDCVRLLWKTATEIDNYGFEIERLNEVNNTSWEKIGFVPGNGNSFSPKEYSFIDKYPLCGEILYRLKQIDLDGTFEYYNSIASVNFNITGLEEKKINDRFCLYQNYPNPFNPSTIIKYVISESSSNKNLFNITLKVYDFLGREITELVNEQQSSGIYQIEFDGSKFSSGVYLYQLRCDSFISSKKFILMK